MAKIIGTRAIPYSSGALAAVSFFFFREVLVFSERPSSRRRRTCPLARTCCCEAPGALVLQVSLRYRGVWSDRCREMSRRCAALDLFLLGHAAPRLQRLTVQTTRSFRLTARPLNDAAKPSPLVAAMCSPGRNPSKRLAAACSVRVCTRGRRYTPHSLPPSVSRMTESSRCTCV